MMKISKTFENYFDLFNNFYEYREKSYKTFNVLVIGKTGVGKSTLINALFSEEFSRTGVGKPITSSITKYEKKGYPIAVYDTPGWEMLVETNQQIEQDINQLLSQNKTEPIHVVWYCIHNGLNRFEVNEYDWIDKIASLNVPIILVLTQAFSTRNNQFYNYLKKQNLPVKKVIPVLAKSLAITDEYCIQPHGLEDLIQTTAELLQNSVRESFISTQVVDIDLKVYEVNRIIDIYIKSLTPAKVNNNDIVLIVASEILGITSYIFGRKPDLRSIGILYKITKRLIKEFVGSGSSTNKDNIYEKIISFVHIISEEYIAFFKNYFKKNSE